MPLGFGSIARRIRWIPSPATCTVAVFIWMLALVQTSVLPYFKILDTQPSLVLITVVLLATMQVGIRALAWGFSGGLFVDLFSAAPLGTNALLFTLVAYAAGARFGGVDRENIVVLMAAVVLSIVVYYPAVLLAIQLQGVDVDWTNHLPGRLWPTTAVNLGAAAVLYLPVRILKQWTRPPPSTDLTRSTLGRHA